MAGRSARRVLGVPISGDNLAVVLRRVQAGLLTAEQTAEDDIDATLEEAEFFIAQFLLEDARVILEKLEAKYPASARVRRRSAELRALSVASSERLHEGDADDTIPRLYWNGGVRARR